MKKKVVSVLLALLLVGCGVSGNDNGNGSVDDGAAGGEVTKISFLFIKFLLLFFIPKF